MGDYVVIAEFLLKPGAEPEFFEAMDRHAANSRAEPGCLGFDVCRDADEPRRVLLYETYRDEAAYAEHRAAPSWRRVMDLLPALIEPGPEGRVFQRRSVLSRRPKPG
jgi:(4S)-4-hydroxy-5-phosphonooxypentane-2,3-dione isomerase